MNSDRAQQAHTLPLPTPHLQRTEGGKGLRGGPGRWARTSPTGDTGKERLWITRKHFILGFVTIESYFYGDLARAALEIDFIPAPFVLLNILLQGTTDSIF